MGTGLKGLLIIAVIIMFLVAMSTANENMFGEKGVYKDLQQENIVVEGD